PLRVVPGLSGTRRMDFHPPFFLHRYNRWMNDSRLDRVLQHLREYEHPLLVFDARAKVDSVEVLINFKSPPVPVHTYIFEVHPRDLDHPQFSWTFQRQLYDCLHDYFIEMFTRTPQSIRDKVKS